jgi:hypothetical protein
MLSVITPWALRQNKLNWIVCGRFYDNPSCMCRPEKDYEYRHQKNWESYRHDHSVMIFRGKSISCLPVMIGLRLNRRFAFRRRNMLLSISTHLNIQMQENGFVEIIPKSRQDCLNKTFSSRNTILHVLADFYIIRVRVYSQAPTVTLLKYSHNTACLKSYFMHIQAPPLLKSWCILYELVHAADAWPNWEYQIRFFHYLFDN